MSETGLKVTTGEASEIVHVHESTVKRWCDAGRLDYELTQGGHRRVVLSSLLDYAREENLECDLLPFGEEAEIVYQTLQRARDDRFSASVAFLFGGLRGRRDDTIGPFLRLLLSEGLRLEQLFDNVVGPVMHRVGNGWSSGAIGVGDEHLMTELLTDALYTLRGAAPREPSCGRSAVIGCVEGNRHDLGVNMARMVLESRGWRVVYLGADVPIHEFALQQQKTTSTLVGLGLAPPQVASDAMNVLRVLGGLYRADVPYRIALGGEPVRQLGPSDLVGHPFDDCRAFDGLSSFSQWL